MSFARRFLNGFFSFGRGASYILDKRLLRYVILPAMLSLLTGVVLMVLFFMLIVFSLDSATQSIVSLNFWHEIGLRDSAASGSYDQSGYWNLFIKVLAAFIAFILSIMLYRIIVTVSVNPFLGPLLEQVELREIGHRIPTTVKLDTANILRGLWNSIKLSLLGLVVLVVGLCLGPLEVPVNVMYQSYAIGRGSFDIVVEKHAARLRDRKLFYKSWRPEIWGHGLAYFLVLLIPVLGVLIAPVCSCTGLSALFLRREREVVRGTLQA